MASEKAELSMGRDLEGERFTVQNSESVIQLRIYKEKDLVRKEIRPIST